MTPICEHWTSLNRPAYLRPLDDSKGFPPSCAEESDRGDWLPVQTDVSGRPGELEWIYR
ncbi:MAG: hypothetical protein JSS02_31455 [Planctomycetes bacterium]|nr:hypothetical protein [Planctomycetota bacterium]